MTWQHDLGIRAIRADVLNNQFAAGVIGSPIVVDTSINDVSVSNGGGVAVTMTLWVTFDLHSTQKTDSIPNSGITIA